MADFIAWSHSRLKTYECPKQFYHLTIAPRGSAERIEFEQTQPMLDGNEVDNALTTRIRDATPLPEKFSRFEALASAVLNTKGQVFTQMNLALNQQMEPCGYKDWNNAWVRVIYDVAVVDKDRAFIGDWKNGQIRVDEDQLRLFATVGFHQFPEVERIDTSYIWLKHGITSDKIYHRQELPDLWETFIPKVERLQVSFKTNHWPAAPDKQRCKWCTVNKRKMCSSAAVKFGG